MHRHTYANQHDRRRDFWVGYAGWFIVNLVTIGVVQLASSSEVGRNAAPVVLGVQPLLNVAVTIVLAFTRGFAALGILMAFATMFLLTVIGGVFFTVGDFVASAAGGRFEIALGVLILGLLVALVVVFFVLRAVHRGIK